MAYEPVAAPPATPPRYSLLAAAQVLDNGDRWEGGIAWTPESCGASGVLPGTCEIQTDREAPASPSRQVSNPFYVWAADECSTFGHAARDWQGRARRQLEATQSFQIAHELWTGDITGAEQEVDVQSPFLADENTVVGTVPATGDPVLDIPLVEAWAMKCSQGRRVMLHMSLAVFTAYVNAVGQPGVTITGSVAITALGNVLVTDAGYPGTGPQGEADTGDEWVYASPLVQIRLGPVEMLPETLDDARGLAASIRRPVNTATVWAQRLAAYQLDNCCRFAASIGMDRADSTPPTPAPET